jgi:quercetin dioxygenase-like cupin family protein
MENKNLETLESLIKSQNNNVMYECKNGKCIGINLYSEPDVGVMRLYMTKGAEFPEHIHEKEKEIGVVYSGKFLVRKRGKVYKYGIGDHFYFEKGEAHSGKALEDCWVVFISVPVAGGYPSG